MDAAKIRLSAKEMRLAKSSRFILTKNAIIEKTKELLGALKKEYDRELEGIEFPVEFASPKISKGENYRGLPWLILDHPRYFKGDDILAIRSLFWWGKFFSITLHLSGSPKKEAEKNILASFKTLRKQGFFICVNDDQWLHEMGKKNYRSLKEMKAGEFERILGEKKFIKLSHKVSLKKWEKAIPILVKYYRELIKLPGRPPEH